MKHPPKTPTERNILLIDHGNLHFELRDHSKWVRHYCRLEAKAKANKARAEDKLELTKAELSFKIRSNPDKYFRNILARGKGPTEDMVKMCVLLQPEYKRAQTDLIRAKERVDVVHAMVQALEHRKGNLGDTVMLHGRDYWADRVQTRNNDKRAKEYLRNKRRIISD